MAQQEQNPDNSALINAVLASDVFANLSDTFYRVDLEGKVVLTSPGAKELLLYEVEEAIGMTLADMYEDPAFREEFQAILSRDGVVRGFQAWMIRKDGSRVLVETNAHYVTDANGAVIGVEGIARDVTERFHTEQLNTRLGRIIEDSANEVFVYREDDLRFITVNKGARDNLGYSMKELQTLTPIDIKPKYTEAQFLSAIEPLRSGTLALLDFETVHERKDGTTYPVEIRIQLSRAETPPVFIAITQDITERKRAEEELFAAQKMEAVGQLTGGIAHDFNNLLTVAMGNIELVETLQFQDDQSSQWLGLAYGALEKAANLTQRLLAYSRRQELKPVLTRPVDLVNGLKELLRGAIPENIDIVVTHDEKQGWCEIDPVQFESAMLNLVINARDAMPTGGTLTVKTGEVNLANKELEGDHTLPPGSYQRISVSDNGEGMSPETRARAFDPFFTTKEEGKGSGLGLSMIYGFVKQSEGFVYIESDQGEGTTVTILLPTRAEVIANDEGLGNQLDAGKEKARVLVLEDNEDLAVVVEQMLKTLEYIPFVAYDVESAQEILEREPIDLLLTDVILKGHQTGVDFAEQVRQRWQDIQVLYMSGYTRDALFQSGREDPNTPLLRKPFRRQELAEMVASVLKD